jgi:phage terminase Nu1 subunit (DNA packaging protein)
VQREAAAERALKEAEEKRKRDEEAAEQARLTAERTAALQVKADFEPCKSFLWQSVRLLCRCGDPAIPGI